MRRGLYVGRFQPFHLGHLHGVRYCLSKVDDLVIVIGSSQKSHEPENPFTAGERATMIRDALQEAGVDCSRYFIIPVSDVEMHSAWVAHVCAQTPKFEIVFSNEPLTRRLFEEAGYPIEGIPFKDRDRYWATEVRNRMRHGGDWEELVPRAVARYLLEINGAKRVSELAERDSKR